MRNKPRIRFKGFTEDWEQRKLGSILIEYTEKNPGNENLPVLTSSRQGLTKQEDHFGSVQRHDISDYNVIPLGFCTYRNRSDDKTFTFNINRIVPRGLVSKFYPVFEIKNGNADFITEYLNNNIEIIKLLAVNAVGTSQVVLSLRALRNIEVTFPLKAEQVVIGNFIRKLDIYITLHQRKLENLKLAKKALLQKLFPKNGSQFPEIRFKGFTDAWEQRKFDEIMTFINGRAYKQDELLSDGKYKVLRVGNFYTNDSWYYSNLELDDKYYAMNGDLLYTWSATFGPHIWKGEKVIYHYHIWKIVLKNKIDKLFALQLLEVDKANIMSDKNGSTMVHITKQGMENKKTILPLSLNEQKQISKFLSSIDKLITLHQRKLDKLQDMKKGLLQKMFV